MIDETRVFSKTLAFGLAGIGVFYATMLLVQLIGGSLPVHYLPPAVPFEFISCFFIIPILMFLGTQYPRAKLPALIYFHLTMIIVYVWFTEVYSPFTVVWAMYILVSTIYFGWKGFIASSIALFLEASWYVIGFAGDHQPSFTTYAVLATLVCTITVATSYLFARVILEGREKNIQLRKSQGAEKLRANQLAALLNSIREPVMTLDQYGRVTTQNASAQEFFNTNERYIGRLIDEILPLRTGDNREAPVSQMASTLTQTLARDDLVFGPEDSKRYVSLQLSHIDLANDGGRSKGVVVMLRDITKEKTLESEKDEFISVTSHELRTPLAIVEGSIGNIELLRSKKIDDERIDKIIDTAHKQIVNLSKIVNDISTISRAEKGYGDSTEPIDLFQLLSALQEKYKARAVEKSLSLRLEIPSKLPVVVASRTYLNEILENIIKNALTFTKTGGITIKSGLLDDGRVFCDISDTGIGISDVDQMRIFDKFYRSEDYRTRETGGTGLGLYEAKMLATRMDASLYVVSRLNYGSIFRLLLPAGAVRQQEQPVQPVKVPEKVLQPSQ